MPANIVFMDNVYTNVKAANVLHLLVAAAPSEGEKPHMPDGCETMDSVWHACDTDAVSALVERWFIGMSRMGRHSGYARGECARLCALCMYTIALRWNCTCEVWSCRARAHAVTQFFHW